MTISATLTVKHDITNTTVLDLSSPKDSLLNELKQVFSAGTSANQIDKIFHDRRTLAPGANETLDLAGSLTDAFGQTCTFVKVKSVLIYNRATTTAYYLQVGGAAANPWIGGLLVAATDKIKVGPSGILFWMSPVDGYPVTAGTGDLLKIDNPSAGSIDYDVIITGTSA